MIAFVKAGLFSMGLGAFCQAFIPLNKRLLIVGNTIGSAMLSSIIYDEATMYVEDPVEKRKIRIRVVMGCVFQTTLFAGGTFLVPKICQKFF